MDREIPKSQLRRARIKRLAIYGGIAAAVIVAGVVTSKLTRTSVSLDRLTLVSVDRGDVNTSVTGYGSVEPAFEEIINSPLTTRVVEVYHRPGDIVEAGTPLLLLDLKTARNEYNKQLDQLAMMRHSARAAPSRQRHTSGRPQDADQSRRHETQPPSRRACQRTVS